MPFPPPGDLSNPGTEPMSLISSALADRFFPISATWEAPTTEYFAPISNRNSINVSATIRVTWGFCLGPHQRVPLFLQYDRLLSSFYCFLSHSFSSVQSLSHVRVFVTPWTALGQVPHPSPAPGACSNSCPSNQWCHPSILASVVPFSSAINQDSHRQIL